MAAISSSTSIIARSAALPKWAVAGRVSSSPVIGLPQIGARGSRVRCSLETKAKAANPGTAAALFPAAGVMSVSNPVLALVDERMTTEGTGLSLGVSNNLLGWILLGVFALIWALYFVYTSTLEEDEESGLSL